MLKNIIITVWIFIHTVGLFAQSADFSNVLDAFDKNDYEKAYDELIKIDTTQVSAYDKATWLFYLSDYHFRNDRHHDAYTNIKQAKKIFNGLNKTNDVANCNLLLISIISHQGDLEYDTEDVISELTNYAIKNSDTAALKGIYLELASKFIDLDNRKESLNYFYKILELNKGQNDLLSLAHTYMNIGTVHLIMEPAQIDSALYFTKKAVPILIHNKNNQNLSYNYNNQGNAYKIAGEYKKAIEYFKKADSVPLEKFIPKSKIIYYQNISEAYLLDKDYKNAAHYYQKQIMLQDSINDTQQNIAISEIKEKYDNEKLRADNLEIEVKRKRNRNMLFASLFLLLGSMLLGHLVFKNTQRKRMIAEKEKELQKQKVGNLLKEQELIAIDAMIEGQEKERQQIASDLHDDLGAMMATLQLSFDNLEKQKNSKDADSLFATTKIMIGDAYQKIRKISHAKNSGVIAKQGLLKAILRNAQKISQLHGINIEVYDHHLEDRIDNSLELAIFRIIQELITNIIKHAEATEATIHLTNHEDSLNIMIEDNGKGFNTKLISSSEGMGIYNIEKRVESLAGSIAIDSTIGRGTTVIIDIPF